MRTDVSARRRCEGRRDALDGIDATGQLAVGHIAHIGDGLQRGGGGDVDHRAVGDRDAGAGGRAGDFAWRAAVGGEDDRRPTGEGTDGYPLFADIGPRRRREDRRDALNGICGAGNGAVGPPEFDEF